jgi:hypothetical protein
MQIFGIVEICGMRVRRCGLLLTTEHTEKHIDSNRETIGFYDVLCALLGKVGLNYFQKK